MQVKAKLWGDHHGLSLLRLLRDELSLPACLFPTSPGGWDWGVWGSWRFPIPPCREGGVSHWLCPPAAGQWREHVGRESELCSLPAGTQNVSVLSVSWCRVLAREILRSMMGKAVGHGCWCWQCHFLCIGSKSPKVNVPSLQGLMLKSRKDRRKKGCPG